MECILWVYESESDHQQQPSVVRKDNLYPYLGFLGMPEIVFQHGLPSPYLAAVSCPASHRESGACIFLFTAVPDWDILGEICVRTGGLQRGVNKAEREDFRFRHSVVQIFTLWGVQQHY